MNTWITNIVSRKTGVLKVALMIVLSLFVSANTAMVYAEEQRGVDLAEYCLEEHEMEVILLKDKWGDSDAGMWKCAEISYSREINASLGTDMGIGSANGKVDRTKPISMKKVCKFFYGDGWTPKALDWEDPYSWVCVHK